MINCTVGDAAGAEEERDASFGHKNWRQGTTMKTLAAHGGWY
jgi:hypothetical protein